MLTVPAGVLVLVRPLGVLAAGPAGRPRRPTSPRTACGAGSRAVARRGRARPGSPPSWCCSLWRAGLGAEDRRPVHHRRRSPTRRTRSSGQRIFDANFAQGTGAPAVIVTDADQADDSDRGGRQGRRRVDAAPARSACSPTTRSWPPRVPGRPGGRAGQPADACRPRCRCSRSTAGRWSTRHSTTRYDTTAGIRHDPRLRTAVHAVPGADALVGGAVGGQPGRPGRLPARPQR